MLLKPRRIAQGAVGLALLLVALFWIRPEEWRSLAQEPDDDPRAALSAPSSSSAPAVASTDEPSASRPDTAADRLPLWSATARLTPRENAEAHWEKHRREFPEYRSAEEYIAGAHRFLRGPPEGTLEKRRRNGDRLLYDPATNTFAVQARNGAPRTMFRPGSGMRYWKRQK